jgi:hypothetical protein
VRLLLECYDGANVPVSTLSTGTATRPAAGVRGGREREGRGIAKQNLLTGHGSDSSRCKRNRVLGTDRRTGEGKGESTEVEGSAMHLSQPVTREQRQGGVHG